MKKSKKVEGRVKNRASCKKQLMAFLPKKESNQWALYYLTDIVPG